MTDDATDAVIAWATWALRGLLVLAIVGAVALWLRGVLS